MFCMSHDAAIKVSTSTIPVINKPPTGVSVTATSITTVPLVHTIVQPGEYKDQTYQLGVRWMFYKSGIKPDDSSAKARSTKRIVRVSGLSSTKTTCEWR